MYGVCRGFFSPSLRTKTNGVEAREAGTEVWQSSWPLRAVGTGAKFRHGPIAAISVSLD